MSRQYFNPVFVGAPSEYSPEQAHFSPQEARVQTPVFSPSSAVYNTLPSSQVHSLPSTSQVYSPPTRHQRSASEIILPLSPQTPSLFNTPRKPVNRPTSTTSTELTSMPLASPRFSRPSRFATDFSYLGKKKRQSLSPPQLPDVHDALEAVHLTQSARRSTGNPLHWRSKSEGQQVYSSVPLENVAGDLGVHMPTDAIQQDLEFRKVDTSYGGPHTYTNVPLPENPMLPTTKTEAHLKSKKDYVAITLIILAVYSTVFSFLFFVIAVAKPRYGQHISTGGSLNPNSAQLLSAIFAKTIELSFVSVFVAFLGQVLSRRALLNHSKGINIAELTMRSWVTQPGTLLTHASSVRFAGLTFLGALALTATVVATLYTTAADTLVSPKLRWGNFQKLAISGLVETSYANSTFTTSQCLTVISATEDPVFDGSSAPLSGTTCVQVQTAGEGYRDLSSYMSNWVESNISSTDPALRPAAPGYIGLVNYNGYWRNVTGENGTNLATLAMPHAGLIAATKNTTANHLLQPEQAEGYGSYDVIASVANPAINVLCMAVNDTQIDWFIAQENGEMSRNGTLDPAIQEAFNFEPNPRFEFKVFENSTVQWNSSHVEAPRFAVRPIPFNTILWSRNTYFDPCIYFLTRTNNSVPSYSICSIHSFITPFCSSEFLATSSGGNMSVNCDSDNPHSLYASDKNLTSKAKLADEISKDYKYVASELASSLSLNSGVDKGNASVSRLLSQLALDTSRSNLRPDRPSLAEALAVMFGSSLLTSTIGSTFHPYFPYHLYELPAVEAFDTIVRTQEYASGAGATGWQPMFYVVLGAVVVSNIFCLVYFVFTHGFITDWTDSPNMFCLLLASPPPSSEVMKDSNIRGPVDTQYKMPWYVKDDGTKLYVAEDENVVIGEDFESDDDELSKKGIRQRNGWLPWVKRGQDGWAG